MDPLVYVIRASTASQFYFMLIGMESSNVQMEIAYPKFGNVTEITIAVICRMSLRAAPTYVQGTLLVCDCVRLGVVQRQTVPVDFLGCLIKLH